VTNTPKPRLKLYHASPSRSATARWMLEEVGEPYDIEVLELGQGDQHKPAYLAINPMGKVPALADGDVIVTEVAAICCYLADTYSKAQLAPPIGDPRRGQYLKWLFFGPSCVEPAITDKALDRPTGQREMLGWADHDTVVRVLKQGVAQGPYLLGEQFTAADVVIGSGIRWALSFNILPELPEFLTYVDRLAERSGLQRQIAMDEALAKKSAG